MVDAFSIRKTVQYAGLMDLNTIASEHIVLFSKLRL